MRRKEEEVKLEDITNLACDIHCGVTFAKDLLTWAGGDANLVREASAECHSAESMKAYIIDKRVARIEDKM